MSVGTHHHRLNQATLPRLRALTTEPSFRRMWARPFRVDVTHQVADTAGYNVLGTVYYLDKDFYAAVMSGQIAIAGMTPKTIIQAILIHERTEKCLLDADNDITDYLGNKPQDQDAGAHEYGTLAEHQFVRQFTTPRAYEAGLAKIIHFNEHKPLTNPAPDLDAEPHVDEMDAADKRALGEMRRAGVADAGKVSKDSVRYSRSKGEDQCVRCEHVSGAVRSNWWCKEYELAKHPEQVKNAAPQPQESAPPALQAPPPDSGQAQRAPTSQQAPTAAVTPASPQDHAMLQNILKQHAEALGKIAEAVKPAKPKKKRKRKIKLGRDEDGNLVADVEYGE